MSYHASTSTKQVIPFAPEQFMSALRKKLPIGIQTFEKIIKEGYLYIDKTKQIHSLITGNSYYFISRPRRFGKSLLISTLGEIFSGNRELFKGLWIDQSDYTWEQYPVITLNFSSLAHTSPELLEQELGTELETIAARYGLESLPGSTAKRKFRSLVAHLSTINKVVLLIDEYDDPIISHIKNNEHGISQKNREVLKEFYKAVKASDEHLKFLFVTGITKFSKTSLFSGFNHLIDLTLDKRSATLLGYTQGELESSFDGYLNDAAQYKDLSKTALLKKIKDWYNGYRFSGYVDEKVYNPFSVLLFLSSNEFAPYWFETGTPSLLIEQIKENKHSLTDIDNITAEASDFGTFDIDDIGVIPLFVQSGYLTIAFYDAQTELYTLTHPNEEVRKSFLSFLLKHFTKLSKQRMNQFLAALVEALNRGDLEQFFSSLKVLFANIPYTIQLPQEKYYQSIIFLIGQFLGLRTEAEVVTNRGRIDLVIVVGSSVYIFEIKVDGSAAQALLQIENTEYRQKYEQRGLTIISVGVNFDLKIRNVSEWQIHE